MSTHRTPPTGPLDLDQARRRARELQRESGTRLTDAQHGVARDLGYPSWPALVRDVDTLPPIGDVRWDVVTTVTVVCVPESGQVSLYDDRGRWACPHGPRRAEEDVWDDCVLRIPMEAMGFRRQATHPFALSADGRHVAFVVDGGPYTGRRPHRTDATTRTLPVAEAVDLLTAQRDGRLARLVAAGAEHLASLSYADRQRDLRRTLTGPYLRATTGPGGSGFGGTDEEWVAARGVLADVLDGLGDELDRRRVSFLDLGCANGLLAESMTSWARPHGLDLTAYGVDVAPELVERTVARLGADRAWVGDALTWRHPDGLTFDVVHLLLDVVPDELHPELVAHARGLVAPGGRLLVSSYDVRPERSATTLLRRLGLAPDGATRTPYRPGSDRPFHQPSVWLRC